MKNILLGVCGSIAAYKSAELVRLLKKRDVDVRVVMTSSAMEFITPMTLQVLSHNDVRCDVFSHEDEAKIDHISLARWADVILIAPASANTLAKIAHGMADDLLTTLCLATTAQIVIAPAMNQAMWRNPITQNNLSKIAHHGMTILSPEVGEQACGEVGAGRMSAPQNIVDRLYEYAAQRNPANVCGDQTSKPLKLADKHIMITAGPTREHIDPVRYLSNLSSGKMGFAISEAAAHSGAKVILITGPVNLTATHHNITRIDITTATELYDAVHAHVDEQDWFIATAAVSDYRIRQPSQTKIKKQGADGLILELEQNPDILKSVCELPNPPYCVGFAAETDNLYDNALNKRLKKGADLICLNDVSKRDIGFNSDENQLTIFGENFKTSLPKMPKRQLAFRLLQVILECCQ